MAGQFASPALTHNDVHLGGLYPDGKASRRASTHVAGGRYWTESQDD